MRSCRVQAQPEGRQEGHGDTANPTSVARYSWESLPLVNEMTYTFVVRIATAAWADRIESQNTDEHSATADADQPSAPELTVEVI